MINVCPQAGKAVALDNEPEVTFGGRHRSRLAPLDAKIASQNRVSTPLRLWMVNYCYNPDCKKELIYLREGRVVRIVHGDGDHERLEHFWLCGPCSEAFEFVFEADGQVTLRSRPGTRPATTAA